MEAIAVFTGLLHGDTNERKQELVPERLPAKHPEKRLLLREFGFCRYPWTCYKTHLGSLAAVRSNVLDRKLDALDDYPLLLEGAGGDVRELRATDDFRVPLDTVDSERRRDAVRQLRNLTEQNT